MSEKVYAIVRLTAEDVRYGIAPECGAVREVLTLYRYENEARAHLETIERLLPFTAGRFYVLPMDIAMKFEFPAARP